MAHLANLIRFKDIDIPSIDNPEEYYKTEIKSILDSEQKYEGLKSLYEHDDSDVYREKDGLNLIKALNFIPSGSEDENLGVYSKILGLEFNLLQKDYNFEFKDLDKDREKFSDIMERRIKNCIDESEVAQSYLSKLAHIIPFYDFDSVDKDSPSVRYYAHDFIDGLLEFNFNLRNDDRWLYKIDDESDKTNIYKVVEDPYVRPFNVCVSVLIDIENYEKEKWNDERIIQKLEKLQKELFQRGIDSDGDSIGKPANKFQADAFGKNLEDGLLKSDDADKSANKFQAEAIGLKDLDDYVQALSNCYDFDEIDLHPESESAVAHRSSEFAKKFQHASLSFKDGFYYAIHSKYNDFGAALFIAQEKNETNFHAINNLQSKMDLFLEIFPPDNLEEHKFNNLIDAFIPRNELRYHYIKDYLNKDFFKITEDDIGKINNIPEKTVLKDICSKNPEFEKGYIEGTYLFLKVISEELKKGSYREREGFLGDLMVDCKHDLSRYNFIIDSMLKSDDYIKPHLAEAQGKGLNFNKSGFSDGFQKENPASILTRNDSLRLEKATGKDLNLEKAGFSDKFQRGINLKNIKTALSMGKNGKSSIFSKNRYNENVQAYKPTEPEKAKPSVDVHKTLQSIKSKHNHADDFGNR